MDFAMCKRNVYFFPRGWRPLFLDGLLALLPGDGLGSSGVRGTVHQQGHGAHMSREVQVGAGRCDIERRLRATLANLSRPGAGLELRSPEFDIANMVFEVNKWQWKNKTLHIFPFLGKFHGFVCSIFENIFFLRETTHLETYHSFPPVHKSLWCK